MELTTSEIGRLNAHREFLGAPRRQSIRVHVSAAPGADREAVFAELLRCEAAIVAGNSLVIKSVDDGTIDWPASYRALRQMGWGRWRSVCHLFRKWRTETPTSKTNTD